MSQKVGSPGHFILDKDVVKCQLNRTEDKKGVWFLELHRGCSCAPKVSWLKFGWVTHIRLIVLSTLLLGVFLSFLLHCCPASSSYSIQLYNLYIIGSVRMGYLWLWPLRSYVITWINYSLVLCGYTFMRYQFYFFIFFYN